MKLIRLDLLFKYVTADATNVTFPLAHMKCGLAAQYICRCPHDHFGHEGTANNSLLIQFTLVDQPDSELQNARIAACACDFAKAGIAAICAYVTRLVRQ